MSQVGGFLALLCHLSLQNPTLDLWEEKHTQVQLWQWQHEGEKERKTLTQLSWAFFSRREIWKRQHINKPPETRNSKDPLSRSLRCSATRVEAGHLVSEAELLLLQFFLHLFSLLPVSYNTIAFITLSLTLSMILILSQVPVILISISKYNWWIHRKHFSHDYEVTVRANLLLTVFSYLLF